MPNLPLSRRSFVALSAMLPWALTSRAATAIPVGLELYSVREALARDPQGTVRAVAQMGYECVEFYAPYFQWAETETKQMRKLMDDLGIRCYSTHNDEGYLATKNLGRVQDMNSILGSRYVVQAWSEPKTTVDAWKSVADNLNVVAEKLEPAGLHVGYHNHDPEFRPLNGVRPIEILAKNTKPSVALQLDVGTCLEAGSDPVAWIKANPGRIRSMHLKDWSSTPGKAYSVLLGEGSVDWKSIFQAAENGGGVEYYLVEQEGSRFSEMETAQKCLKAFREKHSG